MNVIATVINGAIVAAVGLILAWLGRGRFEAVEQRIDRLEERLERRIDGVERRVEALGQSQDTMRSDLTLVALAVGVRPRATNR